MLFNVSDVSFVTENRSDDLIVANDSIASKCNVTVVAACPNCNAGAMSVNISDSSERVWNTSQSSLNPNGNIEFIITGNASVPAASNIQYFCTVNANNNSKQFASPTLRISCKPLSTFVNGSLSNYELRETR